MNNYIRKISATNIFIVPILGVKREKLIEMGFTEAFIKDGIKELEYENAVYLLFRAKNWGDFNLFVEKERERGAPIIDEYDYPDGWTVLVYKYPKKWEKDVKLITTGKYSQISKEFMSLHPRYKKSISGGENEETYQWLIRNKDQKVKDYWKKELDLNFEECDEVWHFYGEREILTQDKLEKYNYE